MNYKIRIINYIISDSSFLEHNILRTASTDTEISFAVQPVVERAN